MKITALNLQSKATFFISLLLLLLLFLILSLSSRRPQMEILRELMKLNKIAIQAKWGAKSNKNWPAS